MRSELSLKNGEELPGEVVQRCGGGGVSEQGRAEGELLAGSLI